MANAIDVLTLFKVFGYYKIKGDSQKIILTKRNGKYLTLENECEIKIPDPKETYLIDSIILENAI